MSTWWQRYIGIPFEPLGRSFAGCDCWGLVRLALTAEKGVDPGDFPVSPDDLAAVSAAIANEQMDGRWEGVGPGREKAFDVAVIHRVARVQGRMMWGPFHVGIVTDPGFVLHCDETTDAMRLCFRDTAASHRHMSWGGSKFEIYRLRGLA